MATGLPLAWVHGLLSQLVQPAGHGRLHQRAGSRTHSRPRRHGPGARAAGASCGTEPWAGMPQPPPAAGPARPCWPRWWLGCRTHSLDHGRHGPEARAAEAGCGALPHRPEAHGLPPSRQPAGHGRAPCCARQPYHSPRPRPPGPEARLPGPGQYVRGRVATTACTASWSSGRHGGCTSGWQPYTQQATAATGRRPGLPGLAVVYGAVGRPASAPGWLCTAGQAGVLAMPGARQPYYCPRPRPPGPEARLPGLGSMYGPAQPRLGTR